MRLLPAPPTSAGRARVHVEDDQPQARQGVVAHPAAGPIVAHRRAVRAAVGLHPNRVLLRRVEVHRLDQAAFEHEAVGHRHLHPLVRAKLDGTDLKTLVDTGGNYAIRSIAVGNGVAFFVQGGPSTSVVRRCALPDCTGGATTIANNQTNARGLALDDKNGVLYWSIGISYNQQAGGAIMSMTRLAAVSTTAFVLLRLRRRAFRWLRRTFRCPSSRLRSSPSPCFS